MNMNDRTGAVCFMYVCVVLVLVLVLLLCCALLSSFACLCFCFLLSSFRFPAVSFCYLLVVIWDCSDGTEMVRWGNSNLTGIVTSHNFTRSMEAKRRRRKTNNTNMNNSFATDSRYQTTALNELPPPTSQPTNSTHTLTYHHAQQSTLHYITLHYITQHNTT